MCLVLWMCALVFAGPIRPRPWMVSEQVSRSCASSTALWRSHAYALLNVQDMCCLG
jgi:hypothetical protein